jgi:hypothetical protein
MTALILLSPTFIMVLDLLIWKMVRMTEASSGAPVADLIKFVVSGAAHPRTFTTDWIVPHEDMIGITNSKVLVASPNISSLCCQVTHEQQYFHSQLNKWGV